MNGELTKPCHCAQLNTLGPVCNEFSYNEHPSSGSSGRVRGGGEKHEIYMGPFGGHIFYDLFSQGQGGAWPPRPPPLDPLLHPATRDNFFSQKRTLLIDIDV